MAMRLANLLRWGKVNDNAISDIIIIIYFRLEFCDNIDAF